MSTEATPVEAAITEAAAPAQPAPAKDPDPPVVKVSHTARRAELYQKALAEKVETKPAESEKEPEAEAKPAGKSPEKTEAKKDPDSKAFAALAREKAEARAALDKVASERQTFERERSSFKAEQENFGKEREAFNAEKDAFFKDPDKVAEHLVAIGVKDLATLKAYLTKQWNAPASASKKDEPKALTQADIDAAIKKDREDRARAESVQAAYAAFDKLMAADTNEAAPMIYSVAEMRAKGDEFANKLNAIGKKWTIEDIADMVEESAKEDPRYLKIQEKLGKTASAPAGGDKKPAAQTKAPAAKTDAVATTPKPNGLNGAKLSHKERMALLLKTTREGV